MAVAGFDLAALGRNHADLLSGGVGAEQRDGGKYSTEWARFGGPRWLEDPKDPDLRTRLEKNPVARRAYLFELVDALLKAGVKGIAMDLEFRADFPEGRASVAKLLEHAHAQAPRVSVKAVGGVNPLLPECPVQGQGSACFDLLVDAHAQAPSPPEGEPFTRLDACIGGRITLSAGLAALVLVGGIALWQHPAQDSGQVSPVVQSVTPAYAVTRLCGYGPWPPCKTHSEQEADPR